MTGREDTAPHRSLHRRRT